MIYKITIFGLLIINLMNWLDGVLTYIGIYIVPKGIFYENNPLALNVFNSIGFFNSFIFKICFCLSLTLFMFLMIKRSYDALFSNIMVAGYFIIFIILFKVVLGWGFLLINYYL